jgi:hypothetical protein
VADKLPENAVPPENVAEKLQQVATVVPRIAAGTWRVLAAGL